MSSVINTYFAGFSYQTGAPSFPSPFQNHTHRYKITVDHTKVDADLTGFNLVITEGLPSDFYTNVNFSDGRDVWISDAGGNRIPGYVHDIDTGAETIYFTGYESGTLSSTVDQDYYLYVGSTVAPVPSPSDTYGRNNTFQDYEAFWDFEQDPSGTAPQLVDLTGNSNDGIENGGMISGDLVAGPNGLSAWDFEDASGQYVEGSQVLDIGGSDFQIMVWVSVDNWADGNPNAIFGAYDANPGIDDRFYLINKGAGDTLNIFVGDGNANADSISYDVSGLSGYHLVGGSFDYSTREAKLYLDGAEVQSGTLTYRFSSVTKNNQIARQNEADAQGLDGRISTSYVAKRIPSNDLISTEYNNQNSPATFYSVGSGETP